MTIKPILSVIFLSLLPLSPAIAQSGADVAPTNPQVDYHGFMQLTAELADYRDKRLVSWDAFEAIAARDDALILDTRSVAAFEQGHIAGAVNLPFSDFTEDKLAALIGDKSRPILIYCNNNFRDNVPPIRLKIAQLALNIPTFINLYGYGYENIYELQGVMHMADPRVKWTGTIQPWPPTGPLRPLSQSENPSADARPAS